MPFNAVFSHIIKKRLPRIERFSDHPIVCQKENLNYLLKTANSTVIGEKYDFKSLDSVLQEGHMVIDLRDKEIFAKAHIPDTINIPMSSSNYLTYMGWFVDFDAPVFLIIPNDAHIDQIIREVGLIGVDNLSGYFGEDALMGETATVPQLSAERVVAHMSKNSISIVDVRGKTEYDEQHIAGASNIPLGYLPRHFDELPHNQTLVVNCASGYHSQIAVSILRRQGFEDVYNLDDPLEVWSQVLKTE